MNLTLSADAKLIEEARAWAATHGTSLNALVKDYLASLGAGLEREEATRLFAKNAREDAGNSGGGRPFSRQELYMGKRFGGDLP